MENIPIISALSIPHRLHWYWQHIMQPLPVAMAVIKDLAIHLNLIPNTDLVIYYDPATDPYTGMANWNNQLQATLTDIIRSSQFVVSVTCSVHPVAVVMRAVSVVYVPLEKEGVSLHQLMVFHKVIILI